MTNNTNNTLINTIISFVTCWVPVSAGIEFAELGIARDRGAAGAPYQLVAVRGQNSRVSLFWLIQHNNDGARYIWYTADFKKVVHGYCGRKLKTACKGRWLTHNEAHNEAVRLR